MRYIIIILFLYCFTAQAQPSFKAGTYAVGQKVTNVGKVWESLKSGKRTAPPTRNNTYWKEIGVAAWMPTVESLNKRIDSLIKAITDVKKSARVVSDYQDSIKRRNVMLRKEYDGWVEIDSTQIIIKKY